MDIPKKMKINKVAKLTGVTVRTLHYYDEIGLLHPYEITEAGYRLYNTESLEKLQQILFFRELDFELNQIKEIMSDPNYDKMLALAKHKELLIKKKERLDKLIELADSALKGEINMSFKEFDKSEFEKSKEKYAQEVKERWGHTSAYTQSQEKTKNYDGAKWQSIQEGIASVFRKFADIKNTKPDSDEAQGLVKEWKELISSNFYDCTNEILMSLGQMYVQDERFTENIDQYGEGTAEFISKAIEVYCGKSLS